MSNNKLQMADFQLVIFTYQFKYRFGWLIIDTPISIMWNHSLKLFNIFLLYLDNQCFITLQNHLNKKAFRKYIFAVRWITQERFPLWKAAVRYPSADERPCRLMRKESQPGYEISYAIYPLQHFQFGKLDQKLFSFVTAKTWLLVTLCRFLEETAVSDSLSWACPTALHLPS